MVRFDCAKPIYQVALSFDEVAGSHCYLETETACAHERQSVGTRDRDREVSA